MSVYQNAFNSWHDVVMQFTGSAYMQQSEQDKVMKNFPEPDKVLYANYDLDTYEGSAAVVWRNGRTYFLLIGSHCSCYGLEETGFDPTPFTKSEFIKYLSKINYVNSAMDAVAVKAILKEIRGF